MNEYNRFFFIQSIKLSFSILDISKNDYVKFLVKFSVTLSMMLISKNYACWLIDNRTPRPCQMTFFGLKIKVEKHAIYFEYNTKNVEESTIYWENRYKRISLETAG